MISIVSAKSKHFTEVFKILKKLFDKDRLNEDKTRKIYLANIKNKNAVNLIVEKDKEVIGYASLKIKEDIQTQGNVGGLSELFIKKEYRGNGYGIKLLKEIIKQAKNKGSKEINFSSTFRRNKAHKLYLSLGFNKTAYFFWKKL
jgi:GNAT superfamily N-acetyltransferase